MKLSINPEIIGKVKPGPGVNLGYGWITDDVEWDAVFELITVDGYATSAALSSDNRRDEYFVSRELLMVDIDYGMTIQDLLTNDFYNEFGAGFYTTPSHTDDAHRFRIMFRLETPETDSNRLRLITRALIKVFDQADQACKDPARLFYGTPGCLIKEKRDNILTNAMTEQLIEMEELFEQQEQAACTGEDKEYKELDDLDRRIIIDALHKIYLGDYTKWRDVGWGLKAGGFSLADFQHVTTGMMSKKSARDAANVWRDGSSTENGITMGTVIHLIKQHNGEHYLRLQRESLNATESVAKTAGALRNLLNEIERKKHGNRL